jgi:putative glutamine amidotransferase
MTKKHTRIVAALYNEIHPFHTLPGAEDFAIVKYPEQLTERDVLILHGGEDIHPSLYKKGRSQYSHTYRDAEGPSQRDAAEWALIQEAVKLGVPIIGICRGAQMLCAAAGGTLYQHVDNHAGGGHDITTINGETLRVNSLHHQMMNPTGTKHELLAWSSEKRSERHFDVDEIVPVDVEPELVLFPELKAIAAQWHPEMMREDAPATKYIIKHLEQFL